MVLAICIYHYYYCPCPTHIPFHLPLHPSSASSPHPLSAFPSCPNPFMAGLPPTKNEWQVELLIRYKLTWLEMLNYSGRKMGWCWEWVHVVACVCSLKWGDSGQDGKASFFSFKSKMMKIIPTNEANKTDSPHCTTPAQISETGIIWGNKPSRIFKISFCTKTELHFCLTAPSQNIIFFLFSKVYFSLI